MRLHFFALSLDFPKVLSFPSVAFYPPIPQKFEGQQSEGEREEAAAVAKGSGLGQTRSRGRPRKVVTMSTKRGGQALGYCPTIMPAEGSATAEMVGISPTLNLSRVLVKPKDREDTSTLKRL